MQIKTLTALVAGAAVVGAGAGLLLSPQAGTETRRQIRRYAKHTQVGAAKFGRSVKSGVDKAVDYGKALLPKKESSSTPAAA